MLICFELFSNVASLVFRISLLMIVFRISNCFVSCQLRIVNYTVILNELDLYSMYCIGAYLEIVI